MKCGSGRWVQLTVGIGDGHDADGRTRPRLETPRDLGERVGGVGRRPGAEGGEVGRGEMLRVGGGREVGDVRGPVDWEGLLWLLYLRWLGFCLAAHCHV